MDNYHALTPCSLTRHITAGLEQVQVLVVKVQGRHVWNNVVSSKHRVPERGLFRPRASTCAQASRSSCEKETMPRENFHEHGPLHALRVLCSRASTKYIHTASSLKSFSSPASLTGNWRIPELKNAIAQLSTQVNEPLLTNSAAQHGLLGYMVV